MGERLQDDLMKRSKCHKRVKPQSQGPAACTERSGVFYRASSRALTGSNGSAWAGAPVGGQHGMGRLVPERERATSGEVWAHLACGALMPRAHQHHSVACRRR
jgi:hypothetical protein